MERLLSVLIGYAFGNLLTAELAARLKAGVSARSLGNPGMANIGAKLGARWGALVLTGDVAKTAAALVLCRLLFPGLGPLAALYAGLGAALGHDFPILSGFRGGKGVAVTCAAAVLSYPAAGLGACLLGALAAWASRYLAVGAAVIAVSFPLLILPLGVVTARGGETALGSEAALVAGAMGVLMLCRFASAFGRIRRGEEKRTKGFLRPRR